MKTIFFFYLLALGVFALPGGRTTFSYSFNASELNTTTINGSGRSDIQYVSRGFEIWETYQNYNKYDGYHSWINFRSPVLQPMNLSSSGEMSFYTVIGRYEPCGRMLDYYNFSLVQEIQHFPSDLTVKGTLWAISEDTLIPYLPFTENILDSTLTQFTTDYYGDQRYRTVKIMESFQENKDLVIQLSAPVRGSRNISSLVKEVIFASGDQCIWTYNISSEDRFVRQVPQDIGHSWNITVPAKDIWYIDIVTVSNRNDFQVDYLLVDRTEKIPAPPSSSYIPCLDFNLIGILILFVLFFYL